MEKCVVCGTGIDNHSYLIENDTLFYTHCFGCQHNLLIKEESMKGMSFRVQQAEVAEDHLIRCIDERHIYCRYDHKRTTDRRIFIHTETMNREKDNGSSVKAA
jgi:hypothetical protein